MVYMDESNLSGTCSVDVQPLNFALKNKVALIVMSINILIFIPLSKVGPPLSVLYMDLKCKSILNVRHVAAVLGP